MTVYAETFMTVFARHCGKGKQYCNDREAGGGGGGGVLGAEGLFREKGKKKCKQTYIHSTCSDRRCRTIREHYCYCSAAGTIKLQTLQSTAAAQTCVENKSLRTNLTHINWMLRSKVKVCCANV